MLAGFAIAYAAWKRRRSAKAAPAKATKEKQDRNPETATILYRSLEAALTLNGITRPASLPPLRHAEDLRARRHPLGDEVVALTTAYIEARFGGETMTDDRRRDSPSGASGTSASSARRTGATTSEGAPKPA